MRGEKIGYRLIEWVILVGGILSAVVASPFISAADPKTKMEIPAGQVQSPTAPQTPVPQSSSVEKLSLSVEGMKAGEDAVKIEKELNPGLIPRRLAAGLSTL